MTGRPMTEQERRGREDGGTSESAPVRRCVVCRNTDRKRALLRFVVGPDGRVHFDLRQKLPGRGISVSAKRHCLEAAARGAFKRGTKGARVELPDDPQSWIDSHVVAPLRRHYRELISLGRRSGQLIMGSNVVERAAARDELVGYLLATDASASTRRKYESNAERKSLAVFGLLDRAALGERVGRSEAVVAGWKSGPLVERFREVEAQLRSLAEGEPEARKNNEAPTDAKSVSRGAS